MAQRRVTLSTISTPRRASRDRWRFWSRLRLGLWRRMYSWAASRKPPVPHAGSQIVSPGAGRITSTMARISVRRVRYCRRAALDVLGILLQQALVPRRIQGVTDDRDRYRLADLPGSAPTSATQSRPRPRIGRTSSDPRGPRHPRARARSRRTSSSSAESGCRAGVTDQAIGRLVARATLEYFADREDSAVVAAPGCAVWITTSPDEAQFRTDSDGRHCAISLPGRGIPAVRAMELSGSFSSSRIGRDEDAAAGAAAGDRPASCDARRRPRRPGTALRRPAPSDAAHEPPADGPRRRRGGGPACTPRRPAAAAGARASGAPPAPTGGVPRRRASAAGGPSRAVSDVVEGAGFVPAGLARAGTRL